MHADKPLEWEPRLRELLPLYGHRNWIVVTDSAFPVQSNPGIETIVAGGDQIDVVLRVLDAMASHKHIRVNVYADKEMTFIAEGDAPGMAEYRNQLDGALKGAHMEYVLHEQIIAKLNQAAQLYRILVIKTDLTIPYTSVFFELDCGYWTPEAERRMREALKAAG
jgi:D-ribose pyranose/furanose isomerase RbsD